MEPRSIEQKSQFPEVRAGLRHALHVFYAHLVAQQLPERLRKFDEVPQGEQVEKSR
jgi:hypothetical protein